MGELTSHACRQGPPDPTLETDLRLRHWTCSCTDCFYPRHPIGGCCPRTAGQRPCRTMMGNRNAPNPTQRAPQKHSQRVVSPRHTGRGEGTYSAPEITTGDAVLHGQAVLTVGDGSPVGNREDARGRREDGKKLRKTQTTISWSFLTTTCAHAGSPASAFTQQAAQCTAAVDRAISVNRQRLRRGCRHHRRPRARRGMTTTGGPCVQFHEMHPVHFAPGAGAQGAHALCWQRRQEARNVRVASPCAAQARQTEAAGAAPHHIHVMCCFPAK